MSVSYLFNLQYEFTWLFGASSTIGTLLYEVPCLFSISSTTGTLMYGVTNKQEMVRIKYERAQEKGVDDEGGLPQ